MGRGRQIIRQWKILRALEGARLGLSIAELREVIEEPASERTVYRDAEQLCSAGWPMMKDGARWRLLRAEEGAWAVPLEPSHLLALTVTEELLAPLEGSYLAEPLRELRERLQATLTPAARLYAAELRRTAVATLGSPGRYAGKRRVLATIHEAIESPRRLVFFGYRS